MDTQLSQHCGACSHGGPLGSCLKEITRGSGRAPPSGIRSTQSAGLAGPCLQPSMNQVPTHHVQEQTSQPVALLGGLSGQGIRLFYSSAGPESPVKGPHQLILPPHFSRKANSSASIPAHPGNLTGERWAAAEGTLWCWVVWGPN